MTRGRGYFISSMNPDTTYENFIYTALGNIFHRRSILLHWVIKKKKKGNESIIQGVLIRRKIKYVTLNIPINRWKYRTFESEIFGLDKKDVENREVELEVIMLIFHGGLGSIWTFRINFIFFENCTKISFLKNLLHRRGIKIL